MLGVVQADKVVVVVRRPEAYQSDKEVRDQGMRRGSDKDASGDITLAVLWVVPW